MIFGQSFYLFFNVFKNANGIKVLFLKRNRLYVTLGDFFWREMTRAVSSSFHLNNARVYIGPYKPSGFKNNTFIL